MMKHEDLNYGPAKFQPLRRVVIGNKNIAGWWIDVAAFAMFVLCCFLLYNGIIWYTKG